jgi:MFS family permease
MGDIQSVHYRTTEATAPVAISSCNLRHNMCLSGLWHIGISLFDDLTAVLFEHLHNIFLFRRTVQLHVNYHWVLHLLVTLTHRFLYLGNSLGYLVGSIVGGRWSDYIFVRSAAKYGGKLEAEGRFGLNAWVGAIMYPLGFLVYGWTVDKGLFVVIPEIGTFFFGFGMMIIFATVTTYLIDAVPGRSSSAVAMNNLIRNAVACIGAIIAKPLIEVLGNGILFSILAGISLASSASIWAIMKVPFLLELADL